MSAEDYTLRDKINQAVDEARNCRRLSYKAKEFLLDKTALRYLRHIDVQAALDWIAEEESPV